MSSPLRSCEEDMVVNSEGGDFDEDEDDGEPLDENASDINSPAALRETATPAAPGTVPEKKKLKWGKKKNPLERRSGARAHDFKNTFFFFFKRRVCLKENNSGPGFKDLRCLFVP